MNSNTQSALRVALIGFSFFFSRHCFASASAAHSGDSAAQQMDLTGSVAVESVGPQVKIGSSPKDVSRSLGNPSRVLADGRQIYFRDFWVDHSAAHGSLLVRYSEGEVSELRVVTPMEGVALCGARQDSASSGLIARK
jgi:hypothetical protein